MTLDELCIKHGADKGTPHHGYAPIYDKLFAPMRDDPIYLLEIGVQFGASIKTWLDYFPRASIAGVDVANDFRCDDARYVFTQADQGNAQFWAAFNPFLKPWDIVIDDGPHTLGHQIVSFDALWPKVAQGGLYIIEDLWTWPDPLWEQEHASAAFQRDLIWGLHRNGMAYYGRPTGLTEKFKPRAEGIEWIQHHPGLMILKKR